MESKESISIIGSGCIGRNLAMVFISGGHPVTLFDSNQQQLDIARDEIHKTLSNLERSGYLRGTQTAEEQYSLVSYAGSIMNGKDILYMSSLIMECVPETVEAKLTVFKMLDDLVSQETVLCSSSSCIQSSRFTEGLRHRKNCLVAHPVNPPYFLPLVELVPAPWTASEAVETARRIFQGVGQAPIVLKREVDGFALNRMQYAVINAAWALVADGIADPTDVDKMMTCGLGPRYAFFGPLAVCQLNADGFKDYLARYKDGLARVSADMNQQREYDEPTENLIAEHMNSIFPIEQLTETRKERDDKLAQFAQLKRHDQ